MNNQTQLELTSLAWLLTGVIFGYIISAIYPLPTPVYATNWSFNIATFIFMGGALGLFLAVSLKNNLRTKLQLDE